MKCSSFERRDVLKVSAKLRERSPSVLLTWDGEGPVMERDLGNSYFKSQPLSYPQTGASYCAV